MTIFDWTVETPVEDIIGQAIGAGSVCWEYPELAGVFDSTRASQIVNEVIDILRKKVLVS